MVLATVVSNEKEGLVRPIYILVDVGTKSREYAAKTFLIAFHFASMWWLENRIIM
jgi:hypothetical protein